MEEQEIPQEQEPEQEPQHEQNPPEAVSMEDLLSSTEPAPEVAPDVAPDARSLRAVLEAIIYVAEEPLTLAQIAGALAQPTERIEALIQELIAEFDKPEHGVTIREVAGGYKMATKPEHHRRSAALSRA